MSVVITSLAHDAVCPNGEEWIFHNLPKDNKNSSEDENVAVLEEGKDYRMLNDGNEKTAIGMLILAALIVVYAIIIVAVLCV